MKQSLRGGTTLNKSKCTTFELLPDGQRAELIDGVVYDLAAPSTIHQRISMFLSKVISNHIAEKSLPYDAFAAPFAVHLDNRNYLEPDISVICDRDKLSDRGCEGAPDWIIEIVSTSSAHADYMIKLLKYRAAGVKLYWIVDPDLKVVIVYDFQQDATQRFSFADPVPVAICEEFQITMADALT